MFKESHFCFVFSSWQKGFEVGSLGPRANIRSMKYKNSINNNILTRNQNYVNFKFFFTIDH